MLKSSRLRAVFWRDAPVAAAMSSTGVGVRASPSAAAIAFPATAAVAPDTKTLVRAYVLGRVADPAVTPRLMATGSGVGAAVVNVFAVSVVRVGAPIPMILLTCIEDNCVGLRNRAGFFSNQHCIDTKQSQNTVMRPK